MIDKISINGTMYAVTPVPEGEQPSGSTVTVDGVTYLIGTAITAPAEMAQQAIEKIQVNGVLYDIADVEAVEAERIRATEAERMLANNLTEAKKDIANQLIVTPVAGNVAITGRNMQSMRINFSADIPAATTDKAGVMSAEDKVQLKTNTKKIGDKLSVSRVYENTIVDDSNRYYVNEERDFGTSIIFKCRNNTNATLIARFYTGTDYQEMATLSGNARNEELISEGGFTKILIYYLKGTSVTGTTDVELSYGTYKLVESLADELTLSLESNREYLETQYIGEQETLLNFADVREQLNTSGITYSLNNGKEVVVLQDESNTIKKCELSIPIADYGLKVGDTVDVACDFLSNVNNTCRLLVVSRKGNTNTDTIKRIDVSLERGVARAHLQYTITAEGSDRLFIELSRQQKKFEVNDITITNLVITKNYSLNYNKTKLIPRVIVNPVSAISTRTFANAEYSTFEDEKLSITHTEEYNLKKVFPLGKLGLKEGDVFKLHINQTGNCKSTLRLLKQDASSSTSLLTAGRPFNGYYNETTVLADSAYMEVVLYLTSAGTATYSDIYLLKSGENADNIIYTNPPVYTLRDAIAFNISRLTIGGIEYISVKENPKAITDYVTSNRVCKAGFGAAKKIKEEVLDGSAIVKRLMACDGTYTYWGEQIANSDPQMVPIAAYSVEQRFKLYRCQGADVDNLEVVAEVNQPITGVIVYEDKVLCCLAPANIDYAYTNARIVSIVGDAVTDKLVFPSIAYLPFQAWGAFKRYGDYIYMPCYGLKESTNYANAKGGDKVWLSRDRGETWEIIFDLADHTDVIPSELLHSIHIHGGCMCEDTGRMYITHGDAQAGIFWSDDEGNSWNYRIGTEDKCGPKLQMCAIEAMNNNIVCGTDMSPSGIMMIRDYHGVPRLDEGYQLTPNGVYSLSYVPSNILSLPSGLTLIPCGDWQGYDKTNKLLVTYDGVRFFEIFDEGIPCDTKVYKMPRVLQYENGKFIFDFESIREGVRRYGIYTIQL